MGNKGPTRILFPSWLFPKEHQFKVVWLYVLAWFSQMNVMFLKIKYRLFKLHKINFSLPIKGRIHSQVEPEIAFTCTSLLLEPTTVTWEQSFTYNISTKLQKKKIYYYTFMS